METYLSSVITGAFTIANVIITILSYRHQQRIQTDYGKQLESMRIEYGSLYKKRAEAIEELYGKLYKLSKNIGQIRWTETKEEFLRNVSLVNPRLLEKEIDTLVDFYNEKRIYFNQSTYKRLEEFTDFFYKQIEDYNNDLAKEDEQVNPLESYGICLFNTGKWKEMLDIIITDFQELIGVDCNKNKSGHKLSVCQKIRHFFCRKQRTTDNR